MLTVLSKNTAMNKELSDMFFWREFFQHSGHRLLYFCDLCIDEPLFHSVEEYKSKE